MSKRLLIITCHKLDDNNGGANASKGFIRCFAALFDDCSLIYPEFEGDTAPYIPSSYKLFPCHDGRMKLQKGLDMYRGVVGGLYAHVRRHLRDHQYDVIVIDHSAAGTSIVKTIKQTGAQLITIHHNVERDYLRDNGKERPLTYRLPYTYFAKKSERDCLRHSDVNLTVTAADAQTFCTWYPDRNLHVHPWGIFAYRPIADTSFPSKGTDGCTFIVTGSLCFIQSLQPILEFLRRYWPLVLEVCPQSRLIIAGRKPGKLLIDACAGTKGITIIPNPIDMAEPVSMADYYVCPINAGSGFKLRVMDGLRQGLPVLCHRVSAAGYESMAAAGCLFAYHDELSFADSLRRMLSTTVPPATVYQTFRRNYSTEAGTERLRTILKQENII